MITVAVFSALACRPNDPAQETDSGDSSSGSGSGSSDSSDATSSSGDQPTSSSTGGDDWAKICDGSDAIRLAMVVGGGGSIENELERALGFRYLYVLGTCEYYALAQLEGVQWSDARKGVMDVATEEALSREMDYGGLAEIAGHWTTKGDFDSTTLVVTDGVATMSCYAACQEGPAAAQALGPLSKAWTDTLWEQGEPLLGALRVSVVVVPGGAPGMSGAPWPLTIDPSAIAAVEGPTSEYPTVRIDGGDDLATLRELRRQYREDDLPADLPNSLYQHGYLLFQRDGGPDLFKMWIRDSLPLEDEDGHIPLPPPPL
ncbi:hypothetical protein [Nannocystis punicea]|uniref:Uncharacterized protein n=1 Tax=Nannocystis punicea TaxID=2995304 RepID=A0ABY7H8A4_9BACT|nr:hypothetical protein [Nannocystis poenicansa]WAS95388.1 hypothetical protein O0S08_04445 [Nannocystis poenicansa]